jgi:hypothetical protein
MFPPGNRIAASPRTDQPFSLEERRSEINYRKPTVQEMVTLSGIVARRSWPTRRQDLAPVDIDVLDQLWYLETFRVSARAPVDVIEEAIGVYRDDQLKSWFRTFNPFFWLVRLIDWLTDLVFAIVQRFHPGLQEGRKPLLRRFVELCIGIAALAASICTILWFLGFQTAVQHLFHLSFITRSVQ